MWTREDIVWAAAYYEGEGCLHNSANNKWFLQIASTDLDVLEILQKRLGVGKICGPWISPHKERAHHKPIWHWRLCGAKRVYAICAGMYQFLGSRRKKRVEEFFLHFKNHRPTKRGRDQFGRFLGKAV